MSAAIRTEEARPDRAVLPSGPQFRHAVAMWPILQRELREQARQRSGHWLRVVGAGVVLAVMAFAWDPAQMTQQRDGRGIFAGLSHVLLTAIWLIAPVLTADCLSREKREGTLGLLFLTPLRAQDVVVGKAFVQALRAFTIVLAAIPALLIPVLMGGVSWMDALRMLCLQLATLGFALSAGLVASSVTTRWVRARLLALLMVIGAAGMFFTLYVFTTGGLTWLGLRRQRPDISLPTILNFQIQDWFGRLGFYGRERSTFWLPVGGNGGSWFGLALAAGFLIFTFALVWQAVRFATAGVLRTWQGEPARPQLRKAANWLTRVRAPKAWWRSRRSGLLSRSPVEWRQTATWSARLTTGGWLAVTMVLMSVAILNDGYGDTGAGQWLGRRLLLVGLAFAAAASFREEKDHGGFELLLVTPLSPTQLVNGRLRGLLRQFAPAAAVLLLVQVALMLMHAGAASAWNSKSTVATELIGSLGFLGWMAATSALGLALALSRMNFLIAFLLAAVAHHAAMLLANGMTGLVSVSSLPESLPEPMVLSMALAGLVFWFARDHALRRLRERSFLRAG
jgi:ABC-type transport system involved in multi-copper enzyme maturation permease subunit